MELQVLEGKGQSSVFDIPIRCRRIQLLSREDTTVHDMFAGFDTLYVISYSYSVSFLESLFQHFSFAHAKIILGGEWLVQKDIKMHRMLAEAMTYADEAIEQVRKHKVLVKGLADGTIEIRCPRTVLDHRKYYLLSNDGGTHRVITASANISRAAWVGDNIEFYEMDDTEFAYQEYLAEFETAWLNSEPIPQEVCPVTEAERIENNILVNKTINLDTMVVMPVMPEVISQHREKIPYITKHETRADWYEDVITGALPRVKQNAVELTYKNIVKMQSREKVIARRTVKSEPEVSVSKLSFTYGEDCGAYLNGQQIDLHSSEKDICSDIENLFEVFRHFEDDFIEGDVGGLCYNHWRLLVYALISPHISKLRCLCDIYGISINCLPMYVMLVSRGANAGKTFMMRVILHMIGGREKQNYLMIKGQDVSVNWLRYIQSEEIGFPCLVDEISSRKFGTSIKDELKCADKCEQTGRENQSVIYLTSNDMTDPNEVLRKRSMFLLYDGTLRYDIDRSGYETQSKKILHKFTTALYYEYVRRILPRISDLLNRIQSDDRPDDWYPDVVKISSDVLLSIFRDYGYKPRHYMKPVEWDRDYGGSYVAAENTIREMQALCEKFPDMFRVQDGKVIVSASAGSKYAKLFAAWQNMLPAEVSVDVADTKEESVFCADLDALRLFGFKYKDNSKKRFSWLRKRGG